jgi:hypothetical protein
VAFGSIHLSCAVKRALLRTDQPREQRIPWRCICSNGLK